MRHARRPVFPRQLPATAAAVFGPVAVRKMKNICAIAGVAAAGSRLILVDFDA